MGRKARIGASRLLVIWAVGGTLAFGQAARPSPSPKNQGQKAATTQDVALVEPGIDVETLLQKWEGQSAKLQTLDVVIFRTDVIPAWDEVEYFEGRAVFKTPNLAYIDFKKIKQDDKQKPIRKEDQSWDSAHEERIICTGSEVWQYRTETRQIFIFPLEKDQAAKAIEEGPLPFLFNMKADDAKQRYEIGLKSSKDDSTYDVHIIPKLDVDRESFSQAFVQLDRSYMLPVRIVLTSPDGKSRKHFKLGPIKANEPVKDAFFVGKPVENWKVVRNPLNSDTPDGGPAETRAAAPKAAARPAPGQAAPARR